MERKHSKIIQNCATFLSENRTQRKLLVNVKYMSFSTLTSIKIILKLLIPCYILLLLLIVSSREIILVNYKRLAKCTFCVVCQQAFRDCFRREICALQPN